MPIISSPQSTHERASARDSREAVSASLGDWLRRARENRGLTLDRIADETRIPRRYLEALEHDNLTATPGRFYQRAEIRAYARAVGLDQNLALARLEFALKPDNAGDEPPQVPKSQTSTNARAYVLTAVGIAIVTAVWFGSTIPDDTTALQGSAAIRSAAGSPSSPVLPVQAASPVAETSGPLPSNPGQATSETAEDSASAASVTELVVTTHPAGARVTVNGIGWGISPVTIRFLTPGDKQIRVSKDGYVAAQRVLRVREGRRERLEISLESTPEQPRPSSH
jgi:cytoskeleton protein RodZ